MKNTVVLPHSLTINDMGIDHIQTDDKIIQPKTNLKGFLSPNALISKDETVKAVFRNDTDSFITLTGGHKFGIGMEVYNSETDHDDMAEDSKLHSDRMPVNVENPYRYKTSKNLGDRFSVNSLSCNFKTLEKEGVIFSVSPLICERFSISLFTKYNVQNFPEV